MKKACQVLVIALCLISTPASSITCSNTVGSSFVCWASQSFPTTYIWSTNGLGTLFAWGDSATYICDYYDMYIYLGVDYWWGSNLFHEIHGGLICV